MKFILEQILPFSVPLWKKVLRTNFTDIKLLIEYLELDEALRERLLYKSHFVLNLPARLAAKIGKNSLDDPILLQFVPLKEEKIVNTSFASDPVGDRLCRKAPKLLHKYQSRVLLVATSACAMHCRYCFRQNFDYERDPQFENEMDYIARDPSIDEVILSGGDPLSLDDRILEKILSALSQISHVKKVRFHSRFPVGIPERIDDSFLNVLSKFSFQYWFVVHINHPHELGEDLFQALKSIQKLGIPVLNQAVLLKGINDSTDVLADLFRRLTNRGILPYYLHQLDRVQGAAHFEVTEDKGKSLIKSLEGLLSGYAVPKYVKEISGEESKTPIT